MASYSGELATYTVTIVSGSGNPGATIVCNAGSSGGVYLHFYRSGALPANSTNVVASGVRHFNLNFAFGDLGPVVDLLRNEKPVRFFFRDDVLYGDLRTSPEPVGEEEGV